MTLERDLETKALSVVEQAAAITITDPESLTKAAQVLVAVKGLAKEISDWFGPLKKKAHEAHRALTVAEAEQLEPLRKAETTLKLGIAKYQEDERRRLEEARRQAEEEARKKAEADRLEEARDLERAGEGKAALELLDEPLAPVVVLPQAPAKASGVSTREKWVAVVISLPKLVQAVAEGKVPVQALAPNLEYLDLQARALKGALSIPGVLAQSETIVSARAAR